MRCRDCEAWLTERSVQSLTPERQAALTAHLAACPECRAWSQRLETAVQALSSPLTVLAPPDLAERVLARVERRRSGFPRLLWVPAAAGAFALALTLGWVARVAWIVPQQQAVISDYASDLSALAEGETNSDQDTQWAQWDYAPAFTVE